MLQKKKKRKALGVCHRAGPIRHMETLPPRTRKTFTHCLRLHLFLAIFAGFSLCIETSAAASTSVPTTQSQVIYYLDIAVKVTGAPKTVSDITNWLRPVFQNNLERCVIPATPTFPTSTTFSPTTQTTNSTTIYTTIELNTTTIDTTQSHTNDTITTTTIFTPNITTIATTSTTVSTTIPATTTTGATTGTTTGATTGTTNGTAISTTTITTAQQSTSTPESTSTTTDTTTEITTSALSTTTITNKPTTDTTTHTSDTTIDTTTHTTDTTTLTTDPTSHTTDTTTHTTGTTDTTTHTAGTTTRTTDTTHTTGTTDTTTHTAGTTTRTTDTTTHTAGTSDTTTHTSDTTTHTSDTTTRTSTRTISPVTSTAATTAPTTTTTTTTTSIVDITLVSTTINKPKPSNNPNPNSQKSSVRKRDISGVATGLFQNLEVYCAENTSISNTQCNVILTLSKRVYPCCILQTLLVASEASCNINVTGKTATKTDPLQQNTGCSNPSVGGSCAANSEACDESQVAYVPSNNPTQCGTGNNNCNCSAYCSQTDAFYTFNISTQNPLLNESIIADLMTGPILTKCPVTPAYPNIASTYKSGSLATCNKTSLSLSCTVLLQFLQEVPICNLSQLITTCLNSQKISLNGLVTRAAICGNPGGSSNLLVNVNLNANQFCRPIEGLTLSCQNERVIVMLDEQCVPFTTAAPNVTTTIQPNTTTSANISTTTYFNLTTTTPNITTTTVNITTTTNMTTSVNMTTIYANETMNTTATTNFTTVGNESTTAAPSTTTEDSNMAKAGALLEMSKDASKLNSSQVDQLVSVLENLLSGPNVSMALGTTSVEIVSNLQNASLEAVSNSKNRIMRIVDTVGRKLVLSESPAYILSAAVALSVQKADGTNFQETYFSITDPNNVKVGLPRARRAVRADSSVPQGSVKLPPTLTENLTTEQQQMVSRVQFNFYQKSTLFQDKSLVEKKLNSGILGASVANVSISGLRDQIIINLKNLQPPGNYVAICVFWDFTKNNGSGGWNKNGCSVLNTTDSETVCGCNHLTSFGILLDISRTEMTDRVQATILTFITYIGCGISAIFLAVTLLTYLAFGKLRKDIPSKILIQLCLSLLLLNLVFLVDSWLALYPDAVGLCISTAWFLHYFLLVAFTWMGLEAVHMYIALVKVFNTNVSHYMLKFSLAGWGIPMIVVIIVIAIDKNNYGLVSYGKFSDGTTDEFCWIKNNIAFYVAVVAYFCVIFLFNLVMFIVVLVQLCRIKRQNPHNVQHRTTFQDVRSVLGITILLGLTWGFAFFAWGPVNLAFMYLFAIFNTFQGFFIFIFHCAAKDNVRRQWRTYLCCGNLRIAENSDWSRTATQKTTKKSVTRITSLQSSKSNNSSSSSSYLVSDSSDQINDFGSPFSDSSITADEDPSMDVILNELNSQYRRL